jgi:hypothetical protein
LRVQTAFAGSVSFISSWPGLTCLDPAIHRNNGSLL